MPIDVIPESTLIKTNEQIYDLEGKPSSLDEIIDKKVNDAIAKVVIPVVTPVMVPMMSPQPTPIEPMIGIFARQRLRQ